MGKRVLLFVVTNIAIVVTISIVFALLGFAGFIGPDGGLQLVPLAVFSLIWGMGGSFISLQLSRWMAKKAMGVQLVDGRSGNDTLDWLHVTVLRLARQAGLPEPEIGVYESREVNAFATGPSRKRSLVAVSTGLLRTMDRREAEGVLGHEIAHIANGDMVTMTLIQGVVNAFVIFFSRVVAFAVRQAVDSRAAGMISFLVMIVMQIVLGLLGSMVTAWFSRHREFRADEGGAALAGRDAMIGALRKLQRTAELVDGSEPALAAFKISGRRGWMSLFSTHPDLELRIAALERGR
jgi:heat shock protein HtpX